MIGRFLHSYPGYTAEAVLYMPVQRFWALYQAIPALEAGDDLRALLVAGHGANPGKDGKNFSQMAKALAAQAEGKTAAQARAASARPIVAGVTPGVAAVPTGSLRAERLAKLAALKEGNRETG
jgi:hypothetical protein